jgi:hypothetical protein
MIAREISCIAGRGEPRLHSHMNMKNLDATLRGEVQLAPDHFEHPLYEAQGLGGRAYFWPPRLPSEAAAVSLDVC